MVLASATILAALSMSSATYTNSDSLKSREVSAGVPEKQRGGGYKVSGRVTEIEEEEKIAKKWSMGSQHAAGQRGGVYGIVYGMGCVGL